MTVQNYYFFLIYANFYIKKCKKNAFSRIFGGKMQHFWNEQRYLRKKYALAIRQPSAKISAKIRSQKPQLTNLS